MSAKKLLLSFLISCFVLLQAEANAQTRCIHVFVALCDNQFQGIVPVSASLGNGKDPNNNLYWGAAYGVKSFFKFKTTEWKLVATLKSDKPFILERVLFKHQTEDVYMLADAYDGEQIKTCVENFLLCSNWQNPLEISFENNVLNFGGAADLLAYIGHDGLMDFKVNLNYPERPSKSKEVIILACFSKSYFSNEVKLAKASPLLWTTHLMAPEAYTLKAAIDGWIKKEDGLAIRERAAQAYNQYQKCGVNGARALFTTGF